MLCSERICFETKWKKMKKPKICVKIILHLAIFSKSAYHDLLIRWHQELSGHHCSFYERGLSLLIATLVRVHTCVDFSLKWLDIDFRSKTSHTNFRTSNRSQDARLFIKSFLVTIKVLIIVVLVDACGVLKAFVSKQNGK